MKAKVTRLLDLQIGSEGAGEVHVIDKNDRLLVQYELYVDGEETIGAVQFQSPLAYRFHDEQRASDIWEKGYPPDVLCEVTDSPWIEHLRSAPGVQVQDLAQARHFVMSVRNAGLLEVLCNDFKVFPFVPGTLAEEDEGASL